MKKLVVFLLSIVIILPTSISSFAFSTAMKGDGPTIQSEVKSLKDQFLEDLKNSKNDEERLTILKKAALQGYNSNDFLEANLTSAEVLAMNDFNSKKNTTLKSSVSLASSFSYTIYKQETKTWCSAGTVKTVLMCTDGSSPSQQTIMNAWQSRWGVTYPDLYLMRNYINGIFSGFPYNVYNYGGSQSSFNNCVNWDVSYYQPLVILMKNDTSSIANWPYRTEGHFCTCAGYNASTGKYTIGDPYYFSAYVASATANNGIHTTTWGKLNTVIANKGTYVLY